MRDKDNFTRKIEIATMRIKFVNTSRHKMGNITLDVPLRILKQGRLEQYLAEVKGINAHIVDAEVLSTSTKVYKLNIFTFYKLMEE